MTYQMLLLYTAPDNFTAEMLMAALRENNIPAFKRDLGAAGLLNLYQGNSFEGEQIFVAPEAFERRYDKVDMEIKLMKVSPSKRTQMTERNLKTKCQTFE